MNRTLVMAGALVLAAPLALAQGQPRPKPGIAGCAGPVMELIPGMRMCDLDPGKTVRFLCKNGKTIDVPMVNGDVRAPRCD
ncbi:MAG TPA: hypothetical protein VFW46_10270 [Stellaceae bacterium]|jgi:hypothetical protein|nr:hypothetical protein [Stellaceae bacterium]